MSLKANGISVDGLDMQDAIDMVDMLVKTGRAVPPDEWCDDVKQRRSLAALENLLY